MNTNHIFESMRSIITIFSTLVLTKYFIYLVIAPLYPIKREIDKLKIKRLIKTKKIPQDYTPLVSIIIPAWNEEVGIVSTVKSALANTYPHIEVIVVDDGSTDNTKIKVQEFIKSYQKNSPSQKKVKYIYQSNQGKAMAMNHGISKSKGEIIVTMDADSLHDSHAVQNMVAYFQDPSIDALVGNVKVQNSSTLVGMIQKLEYIFGFYFKRVHSIFHAEYIFGGACAAFRKSTTFDSIGMFDNSTKTEDIEYSLRTQKHGLKSVYAEDVITYTEGASSISDLFKQRTRWKKGRIDVFVKYRELFFSPQKHHSRFLSFVVLPYAVFGDFQLLFEPMFVTLVWTYTFVSHDYISLGISSLFILFTFLSSTIFGDNKTSRWYFFLFPAFWILFYLLVAIEFLALVKSLELYLHRQDVAWQKWQRRGISVSTP